jgi:hypothetical protein
MQQPFTTRAAKALALADALTALGFRVFALFENEVSGAHFDPTCGPAAREFAKGAQRTIEAGAICEALSEQTFSLQFDGVCVRWHERVTITAQLVTP